MDDHQIKIGLVQTRVSMDICKNFDTTRRLVLKAAEQGAKIVCLQELFNSPYFAQVESKKNLEYAEKVPPGKTYNFLSTLARDASVAVVGGSLYERGADGKNYNTCFIFDKNGNEACKYRKMHIPHDPYYYEQYYFSKGDLGYTHVSIEGLEVAALICYDQWFPEAARILALEGVQLIFYPTAIGWFNEMRVLEPFSMHRWEHAMRSHASLNGIYVAAVNRVGRENDLDFWGHSFIADPFGELVTVASENEEGVVIATLDMEKILESQDGWMFLQNRRPESYEGLTRKSNSDF